MIISRVCCAAVMISGVRPASTVGYGPLNVPVYFRQIEKPAGALYPFAIADPVVLLGFSLPAQRLGLDQVECGPSTRSFDIPDRFAIGDRGV